MPQPRSFLTRTYHLDPKTVDKITEISTRNRDMDFGKVVDWAVETLHEMLYSSNSEEPISEREEMDRR